VSGPSGTLLLEGEAMTRSQSDPLREVLRSLGSIPGAVDRRPPWDVEDAPFPRPPWLESPGQVVQVAGDIPLDITDERRSFGRGTPERTTSPGVIEPAADVDGDAHSAEPTEPPVGWDEEGTEVLAWYSPFHQCSWDWGIYIRAYGIEVVAAELRAGGVASLHAPEVARSFLFGHEFGHFQAELMTAGAEMASGTAIYLAGKHDQHLTLPGWGIAEEGLCNALGRQRIPRPHTRVLDRWLKASPEGYRDYARHSTAKRSGSWAEVVGDIAEGSALAWSPVPGTPTFEDSVPVFLVLDGRGPGGLPASTLLGPVTVSEADTFSRDLSKSGNATSAMRAWSKTKELLRSGALHAGCHLEQIGAAMYSVRVGRTARVGLLRRAPGEWVAVMFDQQHDRLYRRMKRSYG
jgi:hypothetical protein